jgi:hypothetical protein
MKTITGSVNNSAVSEALVCYVRKFNDTGINADQCYQVLSDGLVPCSSAGATTLNPAQDGMLGRDANLATNENTDGKLGFNFTSVAGGCVQDNVTGLIWEVKTADFLPGLRDWTNTYTNYSVAYNPSGLYGTATDASGFVTAVNATNLCGFSDWRLPSADELHSIVDYGLASGLPTVDATWFPNTQGNTFWSASPYVGTSTDAWYVAFNGGYDNISGRTLPYFVRLVRAGQPPILPRYTVSVDGQEVTDSQTNLIWRRCSEGMVFSGGTCTGTAGTFTHEAALTLARDQASSTSIAWRLPNVKELASIADKSLSNPAIDATAFPATPASAFWSASPYVGFSSNAWYVLFYDGYFNYGGRNYSLYVRLVRAGQ